jgi:surface antigen
MRMILQSLTLVAIGWAAPVSAGDPPAWAAAQGHYAQSQAKSYVYAVPRGFEQGRCDRDLALTAEGRGVLGGLPGDPIIARGKGADPAGLVGGQVGRSMDPADQRCVVRALEYTPDRTPIRWASPKAVEYEVMPIRTYEDPAGRTCRDFRAEATIAGQPTRDLGSACRLGGGTWEPLN